MTIALLAPGLAPCGRGLGPLSAQPPGSVVAGATVTTHTLLRDLNVHVNSLDDRRIEVINGLPLCGGVQLAVDTTLVSALDSAGHARVYQRRAKGAALRIARWAKERTYREILSSHRCRLVVVSSRARSVPDGMQASCAAAYRARWSALISFAAARAYATSLLALPGAGAHNLDADVSDILADFVLRSARVQSAACARTLTGSATALHVGKLASTATA